MKTLMLPLTVIQAIKRADDMPRGYWKIATPLNRNFYLVEDTKTHGTLFDSNDQAVMRVRYSDLGLNPKQLK